MSESSLAPTVLITGANGFIGSRLSALFLHNGFRVFAGVRKGADMRLLKDAAVEYRYGDVTQPASLSGMTADVDYVIHNAGVVKAKSRDQFLAVNAEGNRALLDVVVSENPQVRKFVYISSLAAAGPSVDGRPVTESDSPHPVTVYGQSKVAGERICAEYSTKVNIAIVRPPAVYGPGDKEALAFFQTANSRIKPLFGDPNRKIQMVHVDDLCEGIYRTAVAETVSGSAYFIAEKQSYTLRDLVTILEAASGKKGVPLRFPASLFKMIATLSEASFRLVGATPMLTREKAGELLGAWEVSTEKARKDLGFESHIPFAQGVQETFAWYRKYGWLK